MPKMKTHSSAKKRFRKTASGLMKRASAFRRHHAWAKNAKRVRQLRGGAYVDTTQLKKLSILL